MEGGDGSEKGMVVRRGRRALCWRPKTVWHDSVLTFRKKNRSGCTVQDKSSAGDTQSDKFGVDFN